MLAAITALSRSQRHRPNRTACFAVLVLASFSGTSAQETTKDRGDTVTATATFGSGCFWCTEAVFLQLKGVEKVVPGYTGGRTENPTYKEVCSGLTGHAEVIQITYDPNEVAF